MLSQDLVYPEEQTVSSLGAPVSDRLNKTLRSAGIPDKCFTTHSLRIGTATTAKEAGVTDAHVKMLGRWKSEAYLLYVRTPEDSLAKLSKRLATGGPSGSANNT